jgi:putative ABC transport system substrate-binding protein
VTGPGGNLTGVSFFAVELSPKRLELLSELVPRASVISLFVNLNNQQTEASQETCGQRRARRGGSSIS